MYFKIKKLLLFSQIPSFVCELWREASSFNIFYKIQPADYKSETYLGATYEYLLKITLVILYLCSF
jgi:hypothetical protein